MLRFDSLSQWLLVSGLLIFMSLAWTAQAQDGLIGYWTFDEGDTADAGGILDRSDPSNRHDATLVGGAFDAADVPAPLAGAGARSLNLTAGDHYAVVNTFAGTATDADYNADQITVSCWIKGWPDGNWEPFVSKRGEGGQGWQLRREGGSNKQTFTLRGTNGGDDEQGGIIVQNLATAGWIHVCGTYDGIAKRAYVNGKVDLVYTNSGAIADTAHYVVFGARDNGGSGSTIGDFSRMRIDDVAIYNRALAPHEVEHLAAGGDPTDLPPEPPQPTAGWTVTGLAYGGIFNSIPQVGTNNFDNNMALIDGEGFYAARAVSGTEARDFVDLSDDGGGGAGGRFTMDLPLPDPWGADGFAQDDFGVVTEGTLSVSVGGTYTVATFADDDSLLLIDVNGDGLDEGDEILRDADGCCTDRYADIVLEEGDYDFWFAWWERGGGAGGELKFNSTPGINTGNAGQAEGFFVPGVSTGDPIELADSALVTMYLSVRNGGIQNVDNKDRARDIYNGVNMFSVETASDIAVGTGSILDITDEGPAGISDGRFNTENERSAPGEDKIRLDFLTDGAGTNELNVEPVPGDTVATDFNGAAASTGLGGPAGLNPGGVPTWNRWDAPADGVDLRAYYVDDFRRNVCYGVTYVDAPAAATVEIGVGSDDSIQLIVNGVEALIVNQSRGWGAANQIQNFATVDLVAGLNKIMVKVFQGNGGHGFRLRLQQVGSGIVSPGTPLGAADGYAVSVDAGSTFDGTFTAEGFIQSWNLLGPFDTRVTEKYPAPYDSDGDTDQFLLLSTGILRVNVAGTYAFSSFADDAQGFSIDLDGNGIDVNAIFVEPPTDGDVVIQRWANCCNNIGADVTLAEGDYEFLAWVREGGGGSGQEVSISEFPFSQSGLDPAWAAHQADRTNDFHVIGEEFPDTDLDGTPDIELVGEITFTMYKSTIPGLAPDLLDTFDEFDAMVAGKTRQDPVSELRNVINTWEHGENLGRFSDPPLGNESIPGIAMRADDYGILALGTLVVEAAQAGDITFGVQADDQMRVKLDLNQDGSFGDGETIIEKTEASNNREAYVTVNLAAGEYLIEVATIERGGDQRFELFSALGAFTAFDDAGAVWSLVGDELAESAGAQVGLEVIEATSSPCAVTVSGPSGATVGDIVTLSAAGLGDPGATYLWTIASGPGEIDGPNDAASVDVRGTGEGDVVVRVQAGQPGCIGVNVAKAVNFVGGGGVGPFKRGDANSDGNVDLSDAVAIFNYLFLGGTEPTCLASADTSGQGQVNITSGIYLLNFLFLGGPSVIEPYPGCGTSTLPSDATLGCDEYTLCP